MKLTSNSNNNIDLVYKCSSNVYGDNQVQIDLCVAQAIVESRLTATPSELALRYCNLFGIKPGLIKEGTDGIIDLGTYEYIDGQKKFMHAYFLSNNDIEDSIKQRKEILEQLSRYKNVVNAESVVDGAKALVQGGWATDPKYAQTIIGVFNQYVRT